MNSPTPVLTKRRFDPQQRGSHSQLLVLDMPLTGEQRQLDAIIVPTSRPYPYLADTLELAKELKVPILLLCSKWASAGESSTKARDLGVRAFAADVPDRGEDPWSG